MAGRRITTRKIQSSKTRPKTSKSVVARRGLLVFLVVTLTLSLLAGLFYALRYAGSLFLSRNDRFELKNINISTDGRLTPEFFCERAGLRPGLNLFAIDFELVRKCIEEVPLVESVEIERRMPDTLNIRIVERVAMAQFRWNPRALPFLIDRNGVVLPMTRSGQGLPLIDGMRLERASPGHRFDSPGIRQCLNILTAADELSLGGQVSFSSFDIRYPDFVTAVVNGDVTVRFPLQSARERLVRLVSVLQISQEQGRRLKTIDLTPDGRNVPVTFYEPPVTPQ